jgi:hypothetical protein
LHIFSKSGQKWSTYDSGQSFTLSSLGYSVLDVQPHPTAAHMFLLLNGYSQLLQSVDSGATFVQIGSKIAQFTWGRTENEIAKIELR